MASESRNLLLVLGGLAALFAWSVWAGITGIVVVGFWMLWLVARDASAKRALQRRCKEQIEQALAAQNLSLQSLFSSHLGVNAIGVAAGGGTLVCASPDTAEAFATGTILEGRALKLPQGDYEIGICVPGRVSGKPYWHTLIVKRRSEAVYWASTVQPLLGARMPYADLR
jgi:hypothetical protein